MQAVAQKRVAYDLSRFDKRQVVKEQVKKERTAAHTRSAAKAKSGISGFSVFCALTVFLMLIALLYSYVNLTEASDIYRKRQDTLEDLKEEVQMLEVSRNQRMGALQIRDYAVNRLGMNKIDKTQITYVSTSGGDRFELGAEKEAKAPSKLITGLAKGLSTVVEYIN